MKKYFMKETGNKVQFGDIVSLEFEKETKKGFIRKTLEVKFTPLMANLLVEEGIVEEREVSCKHTDNNKFLKSPDATVSKNYLTEKVVELEDRVIELEDVVSKMIKD